MPFAVGCPISIHSLRGETQHGVRLTIRRRAAVIMGVHVGNSHVIECSLHLLRGRLLQPFRLHVGWEYVIAGIPVKTPLLLLMRKAITRKRDCPVQFPSLSSLVELWLGMSVEFLRDRQASSQR